MVCEMHACTAVSFTRRFSRGADFVLQHRKGKKEELEEAAGTVKAKAKRFGHWFGHKAGEAKDATADNLSKASVRSPAQP